MSQRVREDPRNQLLKNEGPPCFSTEPLSNFRPFSSILQAQQGAACREEEMVAAAAFATATTALLVGVEYQYQHQHMGPPTGEYSVRQRSLLFFKAVGQLAGGARRVDDRCVV